MKTCTNISCNCTDFNKKFCKWYSVPKKEKAKPLGSKRKPTGEAAFFQKEWARRGGKCFVTGETIPFSYKSCFHILSKGAYKKFRLEPTNLIFVREDLHDDWHILGQSECLKKDPRWQKVIDLYEHNKKVYNQMYKTTAKESSIAHKA